MSKKLTYQSKHDRFIKEFSNYNVSFPNKPSKKIMNKVDNTSTDISFVDIFYDMGKGEFPNTTNEIFLPPKQSNFAQKVYELNKSKQSPEFTEDYKKGWLYRASIAWPSFVRDIQFYYLVLDKIEEGIFENATYSPEADVQKGVDCELVYKGKHYYINLHVDSKKSRKYLYNKKNYREHDETYPEIHLTVNWYDSRNNNVETKGEKLWFYSDKHIQDLINKIEKLDN